MKAKLVKESFDMEMMVDDLKSALYTMVDGDDVDYDGLDYDDPLWKELELEFGYNFIEDDIDDGIDGMMDSKILNLHKRLSDIGFL